MQRPNGSYLYRPTKQDYRALRVYQRTPEYSLFGRAKDKGGVKRSGKNVSKATQIMTIHSWVTKRKRVQLPSKWNRWGGRLKLMAKGAQLQFGREGVGLTKRMQENVALRENGDRRTVRPEVTFISKRGYVDGGYRNHRLGISFLIEPSSNPMSLRITNLPGTNAALGGGIH